jgi:perosamine synthetase
MNKIKVPFFRPSITEQDKDAIFKVLSSGHLTTGVNCDELEMRFSEFTGIKHAVSTNSGTAALHLALVTTNTGIGDIVFIPTLAFASDIQVVEWQGATPVMVDCEPHSYCIDPVKLRETIEKIDKGEIYIDSKRLTGKFKAAIVVDYAGQMADYSALRKICDDYDMILVEDASHALPAYWRQGKESPWMHSGTVADIACFSFYVTKPLTTGEGGMIVTDNEEWANPLKSMRLHGFDCLSDNPSRLTWNRQVVRSGFKYNLPDILAALGNRQMQQLMQYYQIRRRLTENYTQLLAGCQSLILPEELPDRKHSWHLYVVRLTGTPNKNRRDKLIDKLYEMGIQTSVHWFPLHMNKYFRRYLHSPSDMSVSETIFPNMISLPLFPSMTEEELRFVVDSLIDIVAG